MLRLFLIDYMGTIPNDKLDKHMVIQSKKKPTIEEAERLLTDKLYIGAIWVDNIKEIKESDIRFLKTKVIRLK